MAKRKQEQVTDEALSKSESDAIDEGLAKVPDLATKPAPQEPPPTVPPPSPKPVPPVAPPAEPKPVQPSPAVPPEPAPVVADADVDAAVQKQLEGVVEPQFRTDKERSGWTAQQRILRENKREALAERKLREQAEAKARELERQVPSEDDRKRWSSLEENWRNLAVEQEIVPRYAQKIEQTDNAAIDLLKGWGLQDKLAQQIKERGGVLAFSISHEPLGDEWKNEDSTPMTQAQFFKRHIVDNLDEAQRAEYFGTVAKAREALRERDRELVTAKERSQEWLTNRQAQAKKNFEERVDAHLKKMAAELPDDVPKSVKDIPSSATPEQKVQIEKDNAAYTKAMDYMKKMVLAITPEDRSELSYKAAFTDYLLDSNRELKSKYETVEKERDDLKKQLDEIENASRFTPFSSATPPKTPVKQDYEKSDEAAVDDYFNTAQKRS